MTTPPDFLPVTHADGTTRAIAHRFTPAAPGNKGPAIVFLPGYMSDMAGSKAIALFDWAKRHGHACLCLDYSGCGLSEGAFADGTLSRWRAEVLALIAAKCAGAVLLVGSSMGGWLMLLVALALEAIAPERVAGLIGIAAAPDFTDWGASEADKALLAAGQRLQLLGGPIALDCPVRLLHGQADGDVPWEISLRLAAALRSGDVQVSLIKDGDHRLSRPADIALLLATVSALLNPS